MAKQRYNWAAAEKAYMNAPDPHVSLKDVSLQFGIPYQTVRRYAAQHKWNERRWRADYERREASRPAPRTYTYSTRGMPPGFAAVLQNLDRRA